MNEPNMKWNESTKTTDTRKTIGKAFSLKPKQEQKVD